MVDQKEFPAFKMAGRWRVREAKSRIGFKNSLFCGFNIERGAAYKVYECQDLSV